MSTSKDLLLAILSMDSYNQGYDAGIDHGQTRIGIANKQTDSILVFTDPNADPNDPNRIDQAAGFYAISYTLDAAVGEGADTLAAGTTIISYRGTDAAPGQL